LSIPLGGFIFLRFICPALTSPHIYGLVKDPPSTNAQRMLILISKVLQNLAGCKHFKEEYMSPMNEFIDVNKTNLLEFYKEISTLRATKQFLPPIKVPKDVVDGALEGLRAHIARPDILPKLKSIFATKQNTFINEFLDNIQIATDPRDSAQILTASIAVSVDEV